MRVYAKALQIIQNVTERRGGRSGCGLFEQIGGHGQVAAALVLPLTGHVVELRAFRRGAFGHRFGDFRRRAEVASESDGIERLHLRGGDSVHFPDLRAVRQAYGIALACGSLGFKEAAHLIAWRFGRSDARQFNLLRRYAAGGQRRFARFGVARNGVRALHGVSARRLYRRRR